MIGLNTGVIVVALLAMQTGPASRPASQVAAVDGSITQVFAELTLIYELGENTLRAKESWRFRNDSSGRIAAEHFELALPQTAKRVTLDENSKPFELSETRITISRPLALGEHNLGFSYEVPLKAGSLETARSFPFQLGGVRVIMEDLPGLELSGSAAASKRTRELNGIMFAIWDLEQVDAGKSLELKISGLPSRGTLLRDLTLFASLIVLIWMLRSLGQASPSMIEIQTNAPRGVMSAQARKTRLLHALELLERDYAEQVLDEKQYARRQKALLRELATTMRQHQLERGESA